MHRSVLEICCFVQISGRDLFEFNPDLVTGDDDDADDFVYQREVDVDEVCLHCVFFPLTVKVSANACLLIQMIITWGREGPGFIG